MKVKVKFEHWLPKLLRVDGITLYPYILLAVDERRSIVETNLLAHECAHVQQIRDIGVLKFYSSYLIEAIRTPYLGISYEQKAYEEEKLGMVLIEVAAQLSADSWNYLRVSNKIIREH